MSRPTLADLLAIMAQLRDRERGCPWDLAQDFVSIAPYTLEEAFEVADAIARKDMPHLCEELGDLLLQVVFHAQMAQEIGAFTFEDVVAAICEKMVRRHPHVFGDATIADAQAQTESWESIKAAEKAASGNLSHSVLEGVPVALPALMRAQKLQSRAAKTGFDWPNAQGVIAKIREELAEVEDALAHSNIPHQIEELGDLLFAVSNLARFMDTDAEGALRQANEKFIRRFTAMEAALAADGLAFPTQLEAWEVLWQQAKFTDASPDATPNP